MEPLAALTPEECAIFKRDGVLIKRGVLDPDLCRRAIDLLWQHNADHHPSTHLVRDDPSTHVGPFPDQDTIDVSSFGEGAGGQIRRGYGWDVRELGSHPLLLELIPRRLWPWAEQLVGAGTLATPDPSAEFVDPYWQGEMTRGFYCLLPSPPGEERLPLAEQVGGAHVDTHPAHFTVTCLLDDVAPGGGGTLLFPGSFKLYRAANKDFRDIRGTRETRGRIARNTDKGKADYRRVKRQVEATIAPVEVCGPVGTVALWHSRSFHCASANYSSGRIRYAVHCDICKRRPGPPSEDPWEDWSPTLKEIGEALPEAQPRTARL